jgi:hypothetical protein
MNKEATKPAPTQQAQQTQPAQPSPPVQPPPTRINTANLKSSYCNSCSTNATREEIVLNFGFNQDWDRGPQTHELSLEHRIVLNPSVAKRVAQLLTRVVEEYEARHGALG